MVASTIFSKLLLQQLSLQNNAQDNPYAKKAVLEDNTFALLQTYAYICIYECAFMDL